MARRRGEMAHRQSEFCKVVDSMSSSIIAARETIKTLLERRRAAELNEKDGISLLSTKNFVMISYIHAVTLLSAQRVLGHSLDSRSLPHQSFGDRDREVRGHEGGDLVDFLSEERVTLDKVKALELRMRYQIEKLMRLAEEPGATSKIVEDPLSFRPNPANLAHAESESEEGGGMGGEDQNGGIYRPPKVAFMPYTEATSKDKKRRDRMPAALNNLAYIDPNNPHVESTSGLGGGGPRGSGLVSARARELARMTEFEEENMTRLVMNKKEAKRRKMDESTIALGGSASMVHGGRSRARRSGLADEFGDLIRLRDKPSRFAGADGYEELRVRAKKKDAFERSKGRRKADANAEDAVELGERPAKRTRFEHEVFKKQQKHRRR